MKQLTVDVSVHWLIKHFYDSDELWYIPVLRSLVQPYTRLYRFAGPLDGVLLSIAAIAAVFCGVIMPLFSILFGNLLNAINATSQTTFTDAVNATALQMLLLGVGVFIAQYVSNSIPMYTSERQLKQLRHAYMAALLRQDMAWYDINRPGEIATRMAEETLAVQEGIGEKVMQSLQFLAQFVAGIIIAFVKSWKMTLVMISFLPLLAGVMWMMKGVFSDLESGGQDSYARAGEAAAEAIGAIRTIAAFGGEKAEVKRVDKHLADAEKTGLKKSMYMGVVVGAMLCCMFSLYAVGLYYGSTLIIDSRNADPTCVLDPTQSTCFSGGNVMQVLFAALIAAMSLGQLGPNFGAFGAAQGAAASIFSVIDRVPTIDVDSPEGIVPKTITGRIEFRDVTFAYPGRPDQLVLRNFNLVIEAGESVALCGPSGSGKSTLCALILRFYDPLSGCILLDGVDIKTLNVAALRDASGIVQQEPQLFAASIRDNIGMGKHGLVAATDEEVTAAATAASAHNFISKLPEGYATPVTGVQLSGGEKQRIAIARVIIRNPRILLLDEATSALDTTSERIVQKALDRLLAAGMAAPTSSKAGVVSRKGMVGARTALVIAHRLSTITSADRIVVLKEGAVVESGSHAELMAKAAEGGIYAHMYNLQRLGEEREQLARLSSTEAPAAAGSPSEEEEEEVRANSVRPPSSTSSSASSNGAANGSAGGGRSSRAGSSVSGSAAPTAATERAVSAPGGTGAVDGVRSRSSTAVGAPASPALGPHPHTPAPPVIDEALVVKLPPLPKKQPAPGATGVEAMTPEERAEYESSMQLPPVPASRVWAYQRPEAAIVVLAFIVAMANGLLFPAFALILSRFTAAFFDPSNANVHNSAIFYMGLFFMLAGAAFILGFSQTTLFGYTSGRFVRRLRRDAYQAIIRQEVGYFDLSANAPGKLSARLGQESVLVSRTTGPSLGMTIQNMSALCAGLIISFVASWRLALLILACAPFMIIFGAAEMKAMGGFTKQLTKAFEQCAHVASEAMVSSRTVAAFGLQKNMLAKFDASLEVPSALGMRRARYGGLGQGASQFFMLAIYALCFWAGAQFINNGWMDFQSLMQSFFGIAMSAVGLGHASAFAVDTAKAEAAKRSMFALIDRPSAIDAFSDGGAQPPASREGRLELRGVVFAYPSRPDSIVLHGVDLVIEQGTTVALVGPSGSGKSSVVALIERFYDPQEGKVLLDGVDVKTLNVAALRATSGWVQQEAPLLSDSIAYNIEYGTSGEKPTPDQGAPRDDGPVPKSFHVSESVIEAAKAANAYDFIMSFKNAFATFAGDRGNQLSGGQKQRVAIARAIIRKPRILLLDEATSALDSESERIVTETIDKLITEGSKTDSGRRTTIVIAHRLSTIKNVDKIVVIDGGKVVEQGRHEELLAREDGVYRRLALAQDPHALSALYNGHSSGSAASRKVIA